MKYVIATEKAPAAIGPYVQAVDTGAMVYTSGQLGLDPVTGKLVDGVEEQAHMALQNLRAILAKAGLSLADVVKTTVYLQNLDDFAVVNVVYASYFDGTYPARSCVEVARLPMGGLVEIEAVCARK